MLAGESRADPPELARAAQDAGRAGLEAGRQAWSVVATFRRLLAADLTLSRSALGVTLAWTAVGIILGASAWMFFMGAVVLGLRDLGLSLLWALLVPALISALGAGACAWTAARAYEHTRLDATRRQLARLGLAGDPGQDNDPQTGIEPAAQQRTAEPPQRAPPAKPLEEPAETSAKVEASK